MHRVAAVVAAKHVLELPLYVLWTGRTNWVRPIYGIGHCSNPLLLNILTTPIQMGRSHIMVGTHKNVSLCVMSTLARRGLLGWLSHGSCTLQMVSTISTAENCWIMPKIYTFIPNTHHTFSITINNVFFMELIFWVLIRPEAVHVNACFLAQLQGHTIVTLAQLTLPAH